MSEKEKFVLDAFEYHIARCDGGEGEAADRRSGLRDRRHLLEILEEHLTPEYSEMLETLGLMGMISDPTVSLIHRSFPRQGVRECLELSLQARARMYDLQPKEVQS